MPILHTSVVSPKPTPLTKDWAGQMVAGDEPLSTICLCVYAVCVHVCHMCVESCYSTSVKHLCLCSSSDW